MGEVGIHFADIFIALVQRPLESCYVCCAEAEFAFAAEQVKASFVVGLQRLDYIGGAVGRIVVYDEDVKPPGQLEDCLDDGLDVVLFIIGGDNYKALSVFC